MSGVGARPPAQPWLRRAATVLLGALVLVLLGAPSPASAHGVLVRSDPQDGGMVAEGRTTLTLWFAEEVDLRGSEFLLHTVDGERVEVAAAVSADGGGVVELTTPGLERSIYVLDWQTLSQDDGHTTDGSLLFGAGVRPDVVPAVAGTWPGWLVLLARWLDLAGLLIAIGAVAVSGRVIARAAGLAPGVARRAARIGLLGTVVATLGAVATAVLRTPRAAEEAHSWVAAVIDGVVASSWGGLWQWHVGGLLVAAVLLALLAVAPPVGSGRPRLVRALAGAALATAVTADALGGHAADESRGGAPGRVLAELAAAAHVAAVGAWLGGLVVLAVCLLPVARRTPEHRRALLHGAWRAFSPLAACSVIVVVASGLFLAGVEVPDLAALSSTTWGLAVTGKTAALAAVLLVASLSSAAVHPHSVRWLRRLPGPAQTLPERARGWFPRLVAVELAVLTVATLLAALMTSVPTSRQQEAVEAVPTARTATVDGLFLAFEQVPLGPRQSRVVVRVNPLVRPQPGPVTGSDVMLVAPDGSTTTVTLSRVEEGRWEGAVARPGPGTWTAWIAIERREASDAVAPVEWTVVDEPGAGPFAAAAAGVALALLLGAGGPAWVLARRRRRSVSLDGRAQPSADDLVDGTVADPDRASLVGSRE